MPSQLTHAARQRAAFQGIRESSLYLALVTEAFAGDAMCLAQVAYAAALGRPCVVLLQRGVELPAEFADLNVVGTLDFDPAEGWEHLADELAGLLELAKAQVQR